SPTSRGRAVRVVRAVFTDNVFNPTEGPAKQSGYSCLFTPCKKPTYRNIPIVPTGIKSFLDGKGAFWECLCAALYDDGHPCRIVVSRKNGEVMAFCHYENTNTSCGFFCKINDSLFCKVSDELDMQSVASQNYFLNTGILHLRVSPSKLFLESSVFIEEWSLVEYNIFADMSPYLISFQRYDSTREVAPYFEGYLGEFSHDHGGVKQLNNGRSHQEISSGHPEICFNRPENARIARKSAYKRSFSEILDKEDEAKTIIPTKRRIVPDPIYRPSVLSLSLCSESRSIEDSSADVGALGYRGALLESPNEEHLARLAKEGLSKVEFLRWIKTCSQCGRYFFAATLREHIPQCQIIEL
ncbi:hypothetical protein CVT26_002291, partial [Gymnopilus dilepis]